MNGLWSLWCVISVLLLLGAMGLFGLEERMLYHPEVTQFTDPARAIGESPDRDRIQEVTITTADGLRLNAWYISASQGKPTIVFAHGNGGNIGDRWMMPAPFVERGYGFLAFDYRGYGKSEGKPHEAGLYRDLEAASDYLQHVQGVAVSDQVALGESLGGGVVADVASRRPFKAVVLYSTFTSTPDVARHLGEAGQLGALGLVPPEWIMRQRFESVEKIPLIQSPLLIAHGRRDTMIPPEQAEVLFKAAKAPVKRLIVEEDSGHSVTAVRLAAELDALLQE